MPDRRGPEVVPAPTAAPRIEVDEGVETEEEDLDAAESGSNPGVRFARRPKRPFRFRR